MSDASGRQLVLIETSGNQPFIFATNKRREIVGASELVAKLGGEWLDSALASLPDTDQRAAVKKGILVRSSGKVVFIAPDADVACAIIRHVTRRALTDAPTLDVCGTWVPYSDDAFPAGIKAVHRRFPGVRSARPGPEGRFLRLPIIAECATSGLPAHRYAHDAGGNSEVRPRSAASLKKLEAHEKGVLRLLAHAGVYRSDLPVVHERFESADWVGVVHADGNGLGALFGKVETAGAYRDLSVKVMNAMTTALERACDAVPKHSVLPLVAGGDDLTALCIGKHALTFTETLLRAFEETTAAEGLYTSDLARKAESRGLGACAGVAFVKPHFPFTIAYDLCADLSKSAKRVKRILPDLPCSAIDFHVLYDSADVHLARIRRGLGISHTAGNVHLIARPYVASADIEGLARLAPDDPARAWLRRHDWADLMRRAEAISNPEGALPRSQLHDLRAALFKGRDEAEALARDLHARYPTFNLGALSLDDRRGDQSGQPAPDLFVEGTVHDGCAFVTGFLDALEAADFVGSA